MFRSKAGTYNQKSQFIIPASDLMDLVGMTVTKLTFYSSSYYHTGNWPNAVFKVYLTTTNQATFSNSPVSPVDWESLANNVVYSGSLSVSNCTMEIELTTPFVYTTDNLLVAFEQTDLASSASFTQWIGASTSGYASIDYFLYNDTEAYWSENFLPKTTFTYTDGFVCAAPYGISCTGTTLTSATLNWTVGGEETEWQLVYSTNPDFDPNTANSIAVGQNTYTLGIAPDVTYYAYVRANCGDNHYSDWSGPCSFGSVFAPPHDFYPNNVTANTATFTWTNGGDETSWQIVYSTTPDFNPDNASPTNVTEKPFTLANLTTEKTYYAYIRATSGNYHSAWSNVCTFTPTTSQSLSVGGGGNALGDVPVPLAYVNHCTKSEFIIPAEQLTAMKYGTINRLTFYCDAQTWMGAPIWVYVGETDQTSLNADNLIAPNSMTYVHYGTMIVADHQMEVTFNATSSHLYMGGNLVVYFEQSNLGEVSTGRWYGTATDNQAMYYDGTSNQFVGFMPKTTISYTPASCAIPEDLAFTTVTSHAANVDWMAGGSETSWLLQYREANGVWSEAITVDETPSYRLEGLTASTTYEVRVKAACYDDLHSDWSEAANFTTCGPTTITAETLLTEDFDDVDGDMPNCWSVEKSNDCNEVYVSQLWQPGGEEPLKLLSFYVCESENATSAYAILPEISNLAQTQMKFNASGSAFSVGVMENDEFHEVKSFDAMQSQTSCVVYFDTYTGNGTNIAIGLNTTEYAGLEVDDVEVSLLPSCFVPTDLSATDAEQNALTLQWTPYGSETAWQVQYTNNGTDWTTVDVGQSELTQGSYRLQGLSASTSYQIRLRASCGGNNFSDWTTPIAAQTLCGLYTDEAYLENFDEVVSEPWQDEEHHLPMCWQWINASTHERNRLFPTVFTVYDDSQYQSPYSLLKFQINGNANYYGEETVYDQYAILPEIADLGTKQIKFSARAGEWGYTVNFVVGVMTDPTDASTFTPIRTMTTSEIVYHDYTIYFEEHHSGHIAFKLPAVPETLTVLYIEDIAVTPAPDCKMLFDFGLVENSITDHSVTLDWTPNGHETQWQIQYRTDREDWTTVIAEQHPFTLTGLDGNNYYHVRVRARCGEDQYGEWSDIISFNTECPAFQTVPYYEDFESWTGDELDSMDDMLPCWSKLSTYTNNYGGTGPYVYTFGGHSGDNYLYFQMDYSGAYMMAILPPIQNLKDMQVSFYAIGLAGSSYVGYFYCNFEVGVMTDPTDASTYQFIASIEPDNNKFTRHTIPLSSYTGDGNYIVFKMVGNPSMRSRATIDDIVVSEIVNYTNVFTCENIGGGYWNDPSYWSAGTLPTMNDNVIINGEAIIPSGYLAEANSVEFAENGTLHIENDGQLMHNNAGVQATFAKDIEGYDNAATGNYYLIASPMVGSLDAKTNQYFGTGDVLGLLDGFSQSYDLEWRNYKKDLFTIDMKTGYLYANRDGVTLTYSGTLQPSGNDVDVALENESTALFDGYNLIGNPFPCDAYLAGNTNYYRINSAGDGLIEASGVIAPCEGVFVQATETGQTVSFTRNQPRRQESIAFTLSREQNDRADVSTPSTVIDRARIRFDEGHNLGKLTLKASPDMLYIPQNGKDYAVVHSQPVGEMPLNFEAAEDGTFTLSFENATEGLLYCHLIDNKTGADVDLLATPDYTFNAKADDYAYRFKVVFVAASEVAEGDSETFAFNSNGNWIIANEGRATLQVVDLNGRILRSEEIEGSAETRINAAPGLYLIRLINGENVKVQKVVVR